MSAPLLQEIEARLGQLSIAEKQRLLDRLTSELRLATNAAFAPSLAAMAADPDIQRQLAQIQSEFAETEEDGLESL